MSGVARLDTCSHGTRATNAAVVVRNLFSVHPVVFAQSAKRREDIGHLRDHLLTRTAVRSTVTSSEIFHTTARPTATSW
jgi:hypothetical protein